MEAVRFEDFSYQYPKTGQGLDRVTLSVPQGSFTVVTGTNGSGKTTLCLAMTGLVPHFFGGAMSGRVMVEGAASELVKKDESLEQYFLRVVAGKGGGS